MLGILSAALVFDEDLASELEIKDFSATEDIPAIAVGEVPRLVHVHGLVDCPEETVFLRLDSVSIPKSVAPIYLTAFTAISQENFPLNVSNHTLHTFSHA